jgi:uncharacterized membrane protein (DUF485 family)
LKKNPIDYQAIAHSSEFKTLMSSKRKFILGWSLFFLAFYFTLPVLTAYSNLLNQPAVGSISWAWILAFLQFIMTWVLCAVYAKKALKFDHAVNKIRTEAVEGSDPS